MNLVVAATLPPTSSVFLGFQLPVSLEHLSGLLRLAGSLQRESEPVVGQNMIRGEEDGLLQRLDTRRANPEARIGFRPAAAGLPENAGFPGSVRPACQPEPRLRRSRLTARPGGASPAPRSSEPKDPSDHAREAAGMRAGHCRRPRPTDRTLGRGGGSPSSRQASAAPRLGRRALPPRTASDRARLPPWPIQRFQESGIVSRPSEKTCAAASQFQ